VSERIRFHLDEPVDPSIAKALRKHGIDITTTQEVGLRTKADLDQMAFARDQGRVMVTHDADFLRLASESLDHPGVAYCHVTARSAGEIIRRLVLIFEVLTVDEIAGRVEYL
jgi:predicted nuclease of predicted toxin-antitoxin system